jgi:hypothetical protein
MVAFAALDSIEPDTHLENLSKKNLRDVQRALAFLTYPVGVIDGLYGPKSRNAFAEFKADIGEGNPAVVSANAIEALKQRTSDLDNILSVSVSNTSQTKTAIADTCKAMGIGLKTQIAYVLATTQWETAHTFKPVKEAFWLSESWRKQHLHYYPYYGRGYVQLTWKRNYEQYALILDIDLVSNPDLALVPNTALFVLVHGFVTGTFTGRRITDFVNNHATDYLGCRRCINDSDKASEIKVLAVDYENEL